MTTKQIVPQTAQTINPQPTPDHHFPGDTPIPEHPYWMDDLPSVGEERTGDPSRLVWKVGESMPAQRFTFLSADELFSRPPRKMLIDGLLGVNELSMLYSESGAGKTFVTVDLIASAILGERFADEFDIAQPLTWRCPNSTDGDRHHELELVSAAATLTYIDDDNPFVSFRPHPVGRRVQTHRPVANVRRGGSSGSAIRRRSRVNEGGACNARHGWA